MIWQDVVGNMLALSLYLLIAFVLLKAVRLTYASKARIDSLERKVTRLQQEVDDISISKTTKRKG